MLTVRHLRLLRQGKIIIKRLDCQLEAGQLLHLRGPNGAGKSTLLQALAGLHRPTAGHIALTAPLLYLGHSLGLNPLFTPLENLTFAARLYLGRRVSAGELAEIAAGLGLEKLLHRPCGQLSAGQQRKVQLARLWLSREPALWLLDEPFNALDRASCEHLSQRWAAHLASGGAIIFTAHQEVSLPQPPLELAL